MKLVSTEEKDDDKEGAAVLVSSSGQGSGPRFDYGCRVTLDKEILDRLGLGAGNFSVGQKIKLAGTGSVVGVSSSDYGSGSDVTVSVQLEQVGVEPESPASVEFDNAWEEAPDSGV